MRIHTIAIHCSDTPNEREVSAADIHRWHRNKGWDGIGYHGVIKRSGKVERGRPPYWKGAHVVGHNRGSLGICLIGRDQFTDNQLEALNALLTELIDLYPSAEIVGHRDLDDRKPCPNFNVKHWWKTGEVVS
ncbi:MAG: N-acetylmuramoyl-L-alanine amidase [Candidatus Thiodiazotropha sp. (ex Troendleina suluensis)]|nr:N-acetylmuramoyl-L-alanine amidase [Candidatus Thiodiazotropha sp. (ex Troendleina suluensis)]